MKCSRELVEENTLIKNLRSTASSTPKFKKKGNEKQFEVLDHVQSASSFVAATPLQVEKPLEELKDPYTRSWPKASRGLRWGSCFE